jgi:hypothetical protein
VASSATAHTIWLPSEWRVIRPEREPILPRSGLVEYRLAELLGWRSNVFGGNGRKKVKEEIAQGELSPEEVQDRARRFYARYGRELETKSGRKAARRRLLDHPQIGSYYLGRTDLARAPRVALSPDEIFVSLGIATRSSRRSNPSRTRAHRW